MSAAEEREVRELDVLVQLKKFRLGFAWKEAPESEAEPDEEYERHAAALENVESLIAILGKRARIRASRALSPSLATDYTLENSNILRKALLRLNPDYKVHLAASRLLGSDRLWSDDNTYKHLSGLVSSFTHSTSPSSRVIIDAFFLRSAAMFPSTHKMLVMLGNPAPSDQPTSNGTDATIGVINYTAVVAGSKYAEQLMNALSYMKRTLGAHNVAFFAAEAKLSKAYPRFNDHYPQLVLELAATAKRLGKSHIRGALTTGFLWCFIALELNDDGNGATYSISELLEWKCPTRVNSEGFRTPHVEPTSDKYDPALIAGILSTWISKSFDKFEGDQWFSYEVDEAGVTMTADSS